MRRVLFVAGTYVSLAIVLLYAMIHFTIGENTFIQSLGFAAVGVLTGILGSRIVQPTKLEVTNVYERADNA